MKTILTRLKTLIDNNNNSGGTLSYVKSFEVVHPELSLTVQSIASLPKVVFTPINSSESWIASQRKQIVHTITAYLILMYHQRESSIIGDSTRSAGQGKGILDFVDDFMTVVRGHRLAIDGNNYLDKPIDVTNIDYIVEDLGENAHLLIAAVTLEAIRLITQQTLPENI